MRVVHKAATTPRRNAGKRAVVTASTSSPHTSHSGDDVTGARIDQHFQYDPIATVSEAIHGQLLAAPGPSNLMPSYAAFGNEGGELAPDCPMVAGNREHNTATGAAELAGPSDTFTSGIPEHDLRGPITGHEFCGAHELDWPLGEPGFPRRNHLEELYVGDGANGINGNAELYQLPGDYSRAIEGTFSTDIDFDTYIEGSMLNGLDNACTSTGPVPETSVLPLNDVLFNDFSFESAPFNSAPFNDISEFFDSVTDYERFASQDS